MDCQMPVPSTLVDAAAERFLLLSDPTRLRLLNELDAAGELAVGALAARAGVGLSTASKHLRRLEREGAVVRRRRGTSILYRVADPTLAALCAIACAPLR